MESSAFKFSIDRKIEIDSGHRVPEHGSKCAKPHGHRYVIEALVSSKVLHSEGEQSGMVLDFGFLKDVMMKHIHTPCDHATILYINDPLLERIVKDENILHESIGVSVREYGYCNFETQYWKLYVIGDGPPTAEVLAKHWFDRMQADVVERSIGLGQLSAVRVHETPNCSALYQRPKDQLKVKGLVTAEART